MPLTRYQIRNEYGLADPELYRAADRDDPEALLEGVAMAGLVGVLRQLGDLAEFAAEIFHDLHEEVMATATRGHSLMIRVHQLEADFPTIEKALLSQTNHSSFFSNAGVDWRPNLRSEQNLITRGDMPRFVMDSYEECRGPPRLFLLDKFDVAGAGACLKRYTDPSFFKDESASSGIATMEMQREKKIRKVKQKKGSRWRNGETPDVSLTSHAKLHELFLEERVANGYSDSARLVKLKKRHLNASAVDSKTGKSYMEKFLETPSPERKLVCETSVTPPPLKSTSDNTSESGLRMLDISIVSPAEKSPERRSSSSSPNAQEVILKPSVDGFNGGVFDGEIAKVSELDSDGETDKSYSNLSMVAIEKQLAVDGEDKNEGSLEGYNSDDVTSEVDNYVDALPTMESEMETDNEYRPKNNLPFLNVGKYGTDSDPSEEEHMELQAQFLDSQSIGDSSTSDDMNNSYKKDGASFSHSDTLSNFVENTPSDCNGAAKEFPSTETCGAENFGVPSNQPSVIVESLEATSNEHVVSHDKCIEEEIIPVSGDTSCSTFVREMSPTHSNSGASLHEVSLVGPVLDETPCGKIKVGSESSDINENGANVDDSMADVPDDSYQTKDEFTNTSAIHPVDELDVQELGVISDALAHLSNVSELASEDQSGNNSVNEVFQAQCADEDSMESLASRKIDSPRLSISPTEEQLFPSALPEVQTYSGDTSLPYYSDVANPDTMVSKPDDPVASAAVNSEVIPLVVDTAWSHCSEELYPVVDAPQTRGLIEMQDAPQTHGLMEQEFSDLNEDVPQLESISAEVGIPHYEEKFSVEEISRTVDDEEIGLFTSDVDAEGGDAVSVELPSYCPTYPGHEDHVNSDVAETVHVESVSVSFAAVAKTDDDVNDVSPDTIPSPSRNFENLHESLSDVRELNQKEPELDDVVSPECVTDSETQKEVSKLEVVSPDSESNPNNSVTYDHSRSEVSDDGHDFSLDEQTEKSLAVCDVTTASTSLILSNHESESQSLDQSHMEDVASSSTCYLPEPETSLENLLELQADQVDTENLQRDGASDQPEPALEWPLEFKSDQLDAECSQEDQASVNSSNLLSAQIGSANHMDKETSKQLPSTEHINQEICLDTSSGSCPENLRSQPSTSEFLPESEGQELDVMKQTMEPLESIHPSFVLLPEAAVVNLEDMPPLPPLPPMQWRMGKIQHASLASLGEFVGVGQDGFLPIGPIQPSKADEKGQFDVPAPQGGILQPQNPFLPLPSVEDAKPEHVSEPFVGYVVQPASFSLQLPTMVNDANYQYSCPDLGGMQFSNPFLSLSEVSDDRSGHNDLALEGENVQSSSKPFSVPGNECSTSNQDPVFSHGAIIQPVLQPVQQLTPEIGLEPKELKHSLENSELEQGKPLAISVTAPTMVDEQPQHSLPTLEGEIAWLSNTSAVMADSDVGRSNGNPVSKLPRPRNPLIDAVAAHGQSKLRKVTERARPQIEPKVDERDSLLEQIRAKSFNLKPATVTRPSIQGPKTNLKVAAILAKATAIRQALAGSDEDDDEDSWSDS